MARRLNRGSKREDADAFGAVPAEAHEWVSFEDPEEARTWVFDVTFLLSRWQCIFGRGCQGVLTGPAEELVAGLLLVRGPFHRRRRRGPGQGGRQEPCGRRVAVRRLEDAAGASSAPSQTGLASPGWSTGRASSSTGRAFRAGPAAPCTGPRWPGGWHPSSSSRTCAGSSRSAGRTRPTMPGGSRRRSPSGTAVTGARAATSSTGGAPRHPKRSARPRPSTRPWPRS